MTLFLYGDLSELDCGTIEFLSLVPAFLVFCTVFHHQKQGSLENDITCSGKNPDKLDILCYQKVKMLSEVPTYSVNKKNETSLREILTFRLFDLFITGRVVLFFHLSHLKM